jgi:hypothetical protein
LGLLEAVHELGLGLFEKFVDGGGHCEGLLGCCWLLLDAR